MVKMVHIILAKNANIYLKARLCLSTEPLAQLWAQKASQVTHQNGHSRVIWTNTCPPTFIQLNAITHRAARMEHNYPSVAEPDIYDVQLSMMQYLDHQNVTSFPWKNKGCSVTCAFLSSQWHHLCWIISTGNNCNSTPEKAAFQAGCDSFFSFFMWARRFSRVTGEEAIKLLWDDCIKSP